MLARPKDNGTFQILDIDNRVMTILNDFQVPSKGQTRLLYDYQKSTEIRPFKSIVCYSAFINYRGLFVQPSCEGTNCFWETGYVRTTDGVVYYSSKENARLAVALRVLVDYYSFARENLSDTRRLQLEPHLWTEALSNKTCDTTNHYVVLWENKNYKTVHQKLQKDEHEFCILLRNNRVPVLLIPLSGRKTWKEVHFLASNWSPIQKKPSHYQSRSPRKRTKKRRVEEIG